MSAIHAAEQLKEKGNVHFKNGEYESAVAFYSQAIQQNPSNPLLWTNRANARLKLKLWNEVIDDCLRSIEILKDNMKAFYFLGQAQLELNHPNEALNSALTAYDLCVKTRSQTQSAFFISTFVIKCKKAKWDLREKERLRRRSDLLREFEEKVEQDSKRDIADIEARLMAEEIGKVAAEEETAQIKEEARKKIEEIRTVFSIADPKNLAKREVPDYLIDDISFEIMHDPVITKTGHSYERATIEEHLKRNPLDPLARTPLHIAELRPNLALRKACDEFWEHNSGWAYDW